jgi:hypothetical protein
MSWDLFGFPPVGEMKNKFAVLSHVRCTDMQSHIALANIC